MMHGNGTLSWKNKNYYQGEFVNDKPEGRGTYVWENDNGRSYVGEWKTGKQHGKGTTTTKNSWGPDNQEHSLWEHGRHKLILWKTQYESS